MVKEALGVIIVLIVGLGVVWFVATQRFTSWDFRNNLWRPAYLLVHGQSPYRVSVLSQDSNAVWFPMVIGLLFPLGWMTQHLATNLWFVSNVVAIVAVVWLSAGEEHPRLVPFALGLAAFFLFPSTVSHLHLGQFTIAATLMLLLAVYLIRHPIKWLAAFPLVIALSKPQLGVLVLPAFLITYSRIHGVRAAAAFSGLLLLCTGLSVVPLFLAYPSWFGDFLGALERNPTWLQPSLSHMLPVWLGVPGLLVWGLMAIAVFGVSTWLWFRFPHQEAACTSLALTPLITPYIWSWDFVMIMPLFVRSIFRLESKGARGLLGLGYVLCWGLMAWIRFSGNVSDEQYWWVPWLLLVSVMGGYIVDHSWNT